MNANNANVNNANNYKLSHQFIYNKIFDCNFFKTFIICISNICNYLLYLTLFIGTCLLYLFKISIFLTIIGCISWVILILNYWVIITYSIGPKCKLIYVWISFVFGIYPCDGIAIMLIYVCCKTIYMIVLCGDSNINNAYNNHNFNYLTSDENTNKKIIKKIKIMILIPAFISFWWYIISINIGDDNHCETD